jgi:hypothetical protein
MERNDRGYPVDFRYLDQFTPLISKFAFRTQAQHKISGESTNKRDVESNNRCLLFHLEFDSQFI